MARRRKAHHSRHRSRRHIGAINVKAIGTKVLGVAAGAFVGRTIYNMVLKTAPTTDPKFIGIGTVVLGALVPKFVKSALGEAAGDGLLAIGAITTLQNFGLISGVGAIPGRRVPAMVRRIGTSSTPFLSRTVGGSMRPIMRKMVGSVYGEQQAMNRHALGSLYVED